MRFERKNIQCLLFLVIICLTVSCSSKSSDLRTANETIAIQKPRLTDGVDLYLLIDQSGSMRGPSGTDPNGLRFDASKYLLQNLVVKRSDPHNPHRIAVIHFGDKAISKGLLDINIGSIKDLTSSIESEKQANLGNTNFRAALEKAHSIDTSATKYKNVRNKIVVIFTDGEPDDSRRLSMPQYFNEIQSFVAEKMKGFSIYVIGIDNVTSKVKFSETLTSWKKIAGEGNVYTLREIKDLYTTFNQTVQQIFELPQVEQVAVTKDQEFEVQPYLDKMEFHIFTESKIKIGIRRPDGKLVSMKDPGVSEKTVDKYTILTMDNPSPGRWKYEILEGSGNVTILRNPIPFRLQLIYPPAVYPVGKPILIRAQFTKETGEEIKELPDYPLSFTAKITSPDYPNFDEDIQFLPKNKINKAYHADRITKIDKSGEYHIKLRVKGGTKFETSNTQKIFVQSIPFFDFEKPKPLMTYPLSNNFEIRANLKRGKDIGDPKKEFQDNPNDLVLVQIISSPDRQSSSAVWLNYEGDGKFRALLPFEFRKPGAYTLAVRIKGEPRLADKMSPGEQFEVIDFSASPTITQNLTSIGITVGVALVALLFLWSIWVFLWLFVVAKRFSGNLTISVDNQEYCSGYQDGVKFLKPLSVTLEPMTEEEFSEEGKASSRESLSFWVRSHRADAVDVFLGGWLSVYMLGLFSSKTRVSKDDGFGSLGDHISIKVEQ